MYDCSKIKRLTVLYKSKGPGSYAGEQRKVLEAVESRAICEEANSREISIEMLLKASEDVQAVVINTVIPFEQPVKAEIPDSAKKAKEEKAEEKKAETPAPNSEKKEQGEPEKTPEPRAEEEKSSSGSKKEPVAKDNQGQAAGNQKKEDDSKPAEPKKNA